MAPKPDLVKIGNEGFALIDEFFGRKSRPSNHVLSPPQRAPAPATGATTFHANPPQIHHQRYQPQESHHLVYQPQESNTVRVSKAFATGATQPHESYHFVYQPQESNAVGVSKAFATGATQPHESYHFVYQPQESNAVRVSKAFATEATVLSSYQYEAYTKSQTYR